jgi:hypothetical protein
MPRSLLRVFAILGFTLCLPGGSSAALGTAWWELSGGAAADHLGWAVAGVADLDGDGLGDVIVGAPDDDEGGRANAGSVQVLSGADGQLLWAAYGDTAGDLFGQAVAGISDVDGDGAGDVIVGAPKDDPAGRSEAGTVFVYSGATGLLLWTASGDTTLDVLGSAVASVPDLDGDGADDVVIGAPDDDPLNNTNAGSVYVHSGASGALLWKAGGAGGLDHLGAAVGGVADLDGDGLGEVIASAPDDDLPGRINAGSVFVISGGTGAVLWTTAGDSASDRYGGSVAGVADLLGTGFPGVVVGANLDDPGGRLNAGTVYALDGATGAVIWTVSGANANDNLGSSVAGGADVNADGFGDVVAGAPLARVLGVAFVGAAYVYSGADGAQAFQTTGSATGDAVGRSVAWMPDVDGDGRGDLVVGASGVDISGALDAGRAKVFATQEVTADVTPPVISCPSDLMLEASGPDGAVATFAVSATDDLDPAPAVTCEPGSGSTFPLGATSVTCRAVDATGNESVCSFMVTVVDTTAPSVSCATGTTSLWPPNHEMIDVGLGVTVADIVDPHVTLTLRVSSDEPSWKGEADASLDGAALLLRADRDGVGDGRVFLVVVSATDEAGNSSTASCAVFVPKSRSAAHGRSALSQAQEAVRFALAGAGAFPKTFVTILQEATIP